jgi:flavin reductase (DIM6/NTAB) family NADH-FMN oxidoreductase RutF
MFPRDSLPLSPLAEQYENQFRSVLGQFASGVAVVTAVNKGTPVGMTIQSFCSLSLDPPLILLCPAIKSTSWPKIAEVGHLCVNLLAEGQEQIARQFARSGGDKYGGIAWTAAADSGSPMLDGALAWIDCQIGGQYPGGDHLIVTCQVLDLAARTDLRPLVFFQSGFQRTI